MASRKREGKPKSLNSALKNFTNKRVSCSKHMRKLSLCHTQHKLLRLLSIFSTSFAMNNSDAMQGVNREDSENWYLDDRIKRLLLDLQRHWLVDYQNSREKSLVDLTAKVYLV
jgi:hypothetical protein